MGRKGKEGSGLLAWQWPAVRARDAPAREPPAGGAAGPVRGKEGGELARVPKGALVLIPRKLRPAVGSDPTARIGRVADGLDSAQEGSASRPNSRPRPRLRPGARGAPRLAWLLGHAQFRAEKHSKDVYYSFYFQKPFE